MPTYQELQSQIAQLTRQAEAALLAERQAAIDYIRSRVAEYGLDAMDIFLPRSGQPQTKKRRAATPKYRDPATGTTWSGRGREPAWINGKDRNRFLITNQSAGRP
jgi:DNA-binding protein H-NS